MDGSNSDLFSTQFPGGASSAPHMSVLTGVEEAGLTTCDDDGEADGVGREDDEELDGGRTCVSA